MCITIARYGEIIMLDQIQVSQQEIRQIEKELNKIGNTFDALIEKCTAYVESRKKGNSPLASFKVAKSGNQSK